MSHELTVEHIASDERLVAEVTVMPLAAVLAHWRSGWFDLTWRESVDAIWTKEPVQMASLGGSIEAVGIQKPIVLGTDGRVWDGHHRLAVACRLGLREVPVEFAALAAVRSEMSVEQCPVCGLPASVHALWCPSRPGLPQTAADIERRVHAVFDNPSRAWFAPQFWDAYAAQTEAGYA